MIWFLHGNLGSPADWNPIVDILQRKGHECRALNLWKYLECCPKSLESMGELLCAEIGAKDPTPTLCGYSLGGRLAAQAVLHSPELWKNLIFVSTHPGLKTDDERVARREIDAVWATKCLNMPWVSFLQDWDAQAVFEGGCLARNDLRLKSFVWRRSMARAFIDWSLGNQSDCRIALRSCRTPSLWIAGEEDHKFIELGREIAGENLCVIQRCGHRIPLQNPSALAEIIDSFTLPGCHAR